MKMKWHREESRNPPIRYGDSRPFDYWGMYQYRCGRICVVPNPTTQYYDLYFDNEIVAQDFKMIQFAKDRAKPYALGVLRGSSGDDIDYGTYKNQGYSESWLAAYKDGYEKGREIAKNERKPTNP